MSKERKRMKILKGMNAKSKLKKVTKGREEN